MATLGIKVFGIASAFAKPFTRMNLPLFCESLQRACLAQFFVSSGIVLQSVLTSVGDMTVRHPCHSLLHLVGIGIDCSAPNSANVRP